jgi:hypothetical protein
MPACTLNDTRGNRKPFREIEIIFEHGEIRRQVVGALIDWLALLLSKLQAVGFATHVNGNSGGLELRYKELREW